MHICLCGTEMVEKPLFTSNYFECPKCALLGVLETVAEPKKTFEELLRPFIAPLGPHYYAPFSRIPGVYWRSIGYLEYISHTGLSDAYVSEKDLRDLYDRGEQAQKAAILSAPNASLSMILVSFFFPPKK